MTGGDVSGGGAGGSAQVDVLFVDVQARLDSLDQQLSSLGSSMESKGEEAGGFFANAFSTALGSVLGDGLTGLIGKVADFVKDGLQGVLEGQDAVSQLEAVIKSTGNVAGVTSEHLQDFASNIQSVTKFSAEAAESAQSMLLTFTNIGAKGGVFDLATQTALDMAQALGGDVSAQALQLGKALNDPINGISALTRVGVTFSDQQKSVIKSLVATGDVAGAQSVILKELSKEFGGSAEAAGKTFTGQMERAQNAIGEIAESIAIRGLPSLQKLLDLVIDNLPAVQNVVDQVMGGIGKAFEYLSQNVVPPFMAIFNTLRPTIEGLVGQAGPRIAQLQGAFTDAFHTVQSVYNSVLKPLFAFIVQELSGLAGPAQRILSALGDLFAATWHAIRFVTEQVLIPAFHIILPIVKPVFDALIKIVGGALDGITDIFHLFTDLFNGNWGGLWENFKKVAVNAVTALPELITTYVGGLKDAGVKLGQSILDGIKSALVGLEAVLLNVLGNLLDSLAQRVPAVLAGYVADAARAAHDASENVTANYASSRGYTGIGPRPNAYGQVNTSGVDYAAAGNELGHTLAGAAVVGLKGATSSVAGECSVFVRQVFQQAFPLAGRDLFGADAKETERRFAAAKLSRAYTGASDLQEGDVVFNANDRSGHGHVGIVVVQNGQRFVAENSTAVAARNGGDARGLTPIANFGPITSVGSVNTYGRIAGASPQQQPDGTPVNVSLKTPPPPPKPVESPEDAAARIRSAIGDVQARLQLKLIGKDEALAQLREIETSAEKVARKQGTGWREYADAAGAAAGAIKSVKSSSDSTVNVLNNLNTQYAYAGKAGLPAYVSGLKAYIEQQDRIVSSSKAGSQTQLDAMNNVAQARAALTSLDKKGADALAVLNTQYEYAGKSGLPAYLTGLKAYVAQQEEVVRSSKTGSQEQLTAMQNVATARQKLASTEKTSADAAKVITNNRLAAERALTDGQLALAKTRATAVLTGYQEQLTAAGNDADRRLAVEQKLGSDVLKARDVLSRTSEAEEKARLERERNAAVNVQGLTLKQRQDLYNQYNQRIGQLDRDLGVTLAGNAAASIRTLNAAQLAVEQAAGAAYEALSQASVARFQNTANAADAAFRQSFGLGDEGLLKALAATTGTSVAQIELDVEGAISAAKRYAPEAATVIERVYADALTQRRDNSALQVQLAQDTAKAEEEAYTTRRAGLIEGIQKISDKSLLSLYSEASANRDRTLADAVFVEMERRSGIAAAEVTANFADESARRAQALADQASQEQAVADEGLTTIEELNTRVRELLDQGRDPGNEDFVAYLQEIIDLGGPAAAAAASVLAQVKAATDALPGTFSKKDPNAPKPVVFGEDGPVAARGVSAPLLGPFQDPKELAARQKAFADNLAKIDFQKYVAGLKDYTQAQLDEALALATTNNDLDRFNAVSAEIAERGPLNATVKVLGIESGLKALDLYKLAIQGVADVISQTFSDLVAGTSSGVEGILGNMAKMALGIVRQVAVAVAAYEAQAIALAIISGASLNFVQAGLALAAAAAVAGIAAGLESRIGGSSGSSRVSSTPATNSSSTSGTTNEASSNSLVNIPNSAVTVTASPAFVAEFGGHVDRFGKYIGTLVTEGIHVTTDQGSGGSGGGSRNSLAWDLGL